MTTESASSTPLVRARGLRKQFKQFVAVDGVDFDVRPGECFGFLGPNGAGKTSTMRMIGAVSPTSGGELSVLGLDPMQEGPKVRALLGSVPQEDTLDTELTVRENLYIYGRYFDLSRAVLRDRIPELLAFAQLEEKAGEKVDNLSGGMKRRLTIARALVNRPRLVILDEPTTGLDPQARHTLWDRLYRLKAEGTTLILTTHYMDEAEQLCDRLVVMDKGRIAAEGSPRQLIEAHATREVAELRYGVDVDTAQLAPVLAPLAERIELLPDRVLLYAADGEEAAHAATHLNGVTPPAATLVRRATLEDVFLHLTGRSLVD